MQGLKNVKGFNIEIGEFYTFIDNKFGFTRIFSGKIININYQEKVVKLCVNSNQIGKNKKAIVYTLSQNLFP